MTNQKKRSIIRNVRANLIFMTAVMLFTQQALAGTYYVWSSAAGTADGSSFANAYTTISGAAGALATSTGGAKGPGDIIYVANDHVESLAGSVTLSSLGTATNYVNLICVDRTSMTPTTTAVMSVTPGAGGNITFSGHTYVYGITFGLNGGSVNNSFNFTSTAVGGWSWIFQRCTLSCSTTGPTSGIQVGNTLSAVQTAGFHKLELISSTISFAATGHTLTINKPFYWSGGAVTGTAPILLIKAFPPTTDNSIDIMFRGVDLSAITGSTSYIITTVTNNSKWGKASFVNCKLGSGVTTLSITPTGVGAFNGPSNWFVESINSDSASTNYRYTRTNGVGVVSDEAVITLSGGASDGTTPVSRKMVTNTGSSFQFPLISPTITYWNESVTTQTATVQIVNDGTTLMTGDAWMEVEYLGDASFPDSSFATTKILTPVTTSTNLATSLSTWTTTGLSSPIKQSLSVGFTPAKKGNVSVRVFLSKTATTIYFDPKVYSSSGRQYQKDGTYINEGASGGGGGRPVIGGGVVN